MPYCPVCRTEYVEEVEKCADCDVELVDVLPVIPEPPVMTEKLFPVFTAKDEIEAKIVKGILEETGIPVQETSDVLKSLDPFSIGPLADEKLWVPESRVAEATEAIEKALAEGTEEEEMTD